MNAYLPREAEIIDRIQESADTFTLQLRLTDGQPYAFAPGQFNMLYRYGAGEIPISIVSEDLASGCLSHTIRAVGRVTEALSALGPGDHIGLRGPFGRGWPMQRAEGHDVVVMTGGLGCAPSVSVVKHILAHRARFKHLSVLQGVKHASDLIWKEQYAAWAAQPDVSVLLAADVATPAWPGHRGLVTTLLDQLDLKPQQTIAMLCGPEVMMRAAAEALCQKGIPADSIHLSIERNMQCAVGHCGHCQTAAHFVCKDGPVFQWPAVRRHLGVRGF